MVDTSTRNASAADGPHAIRCVSVPATILDTFSFPSPRPSPRGRGRTVRCLEAIIATEFAEPERARYAHGGSGSLSPGERVRVRGNDGLTAIKRRVSKGPLNRAGRNPSLPMSPVGTAEGVCGDLELSRPFGTYDLSVSDHPALKRWAIVGCPSGNAKTRASSEAQQ
jgi:hypothetical protein